MFRRDQWLHPATVLAATALFVSMGGVGYAASQIGTKQLKNGAVTTKKLARNAVTTDRLRDGTVGAADLAAGAVVTGAIGDAVVTAAKLAPGSVGTGALAAGAVTSDRLAGGAVTSDRIADGAVTPGKIAEGAVTSSQIADGSVRRSDLDLTSVADVRSHASTAANDGGSHDLLAIDGFGTVQAYCTNTQVNVFYSLSSPVTQRAHLFGHDPTDNSPVGAAGLNGTAGGIGYGGTAFLSDVTIWSATAERVMRVEVRVTGGSSCRFWARATIDRNDA